MKQILLSLLLLTTLSVSAQEFKPFKVNLSLGYAKPVGAGASGGILLSLEPKYGLSDRVDLGLRYELGLMARPYSIDGVDAESELKGSSSYLITGNYLLSDANFRPFIGAGVGLFTIVNVSFSEGSGSADGGISGGNKLGGMLRAGFKASHFVLGLEYNLIPKTKGILVGTSGANLNYESPNAYLGVKLGLDIGGGRN